MRSLRPGSYFFFQFLSTFLFSFFFSVAPPPLCIPGSYTQKKEERKRLDATFFFIVYGLSDSDWTRNEYTACFVFVFFFFLPFFESPFPLSCAWLCLFSFVFIMGYGF
ncbi:uncharacterized protein ASPGLDRAFT_1235841 [Aspergillus glaucus CBS 516.65]|uniref:Uncharacterized protein n=1 Tax=Aspergillus glaucus CBS 516.65 TaxID=1160497 RepID=A0A1L9VRI2_ASPGL|nr:hypothetical protein ASPGLDRAFT_1235841 [Aspergillus glaucus CBS 516.65]OJJ86506.1 hypothetical protein ASPGLDRAFT_1235841 [Aspergillus glaucus CBS 516.65]